MRATGAWVVPDWPAPPRVRAVSTTRLGGVSTGPYVGLNLGDHVGDAPAAVAANRAALVRRLGLAGQPAWLRQVHGTAVVDAHRVGSPAEADASLAQEPGAVCAVLSADCLPVLFCDRAGGSVAAAHAGWRGLAAGVLEATVDAFDAPACELMAWLGPAIGPRRFEVGAELRALFLDQDPANVEAFAPASGGRWLADLYRLAENRLRLKGVTAIYGGGLCTYSDAQRFYSYRRERVTGRMASLIWLRGP